MHFKTASENAVITSFSLVIVLLGLLVFPNVSFINAINSRFSDTLFLLRAQAVPTGRAHAEDVVVIGVDDESYRRLNRAWPWRREVFAIFLDTLHDEYKPKIVGLDFTFVGKSSHPEDDEWLADSLKRSGNVVIASYFGTEGGYILPLDIFRKAAVACGFVDKSLERDFIHRRSRFITKFRKELRPVNAFAAEIACRFKNEDTDRCLAERAVTASEPQILSYRYAPSSYRYVSFWKVLLKGVPREALEGKILLVGAVSPIFHDIHNTPLGYIPGIYVNANETLMLLQKDIVKPLFSDWLCKAVLLFVTVLSSLIFYRVSVTAQLALLSLTLAGSYILSWVLLYHFNYLLEPLPLMMVFLAAYAVCASYQRLSAFSENVRLQKMVVTDGLTGLYGQRYLSLRIAKEYEHAEIGGHELCYAMLDVDNFKQINDRYGHEEGNAALVSLARCIKKNVRGVDVAARYGGDEFAVLFINCPVDKAFESVLKIKRMFEEQTFFSGSESFHVALSAGICSNHAAGVETKEDFIRFADQALYESKTQGRSRVSIYRPKVN